MIKLYSLQGDLQGSKVLLTANFLGIQVDAINFSEKDLSSTEFLKKSPFGTVPLIDTESGPLTEINSILRYLARQAEGKGLRTYGKDTFESSKIDAWLDWELANLTPLVKLSKSKSGEIGATLESHLKTLDNHLLHNSFLVLSSLSIADLSLILTLTAIVKNLQEPEFKKRFPSISRWAMFITSQEPWKTVVEDFKGEGVAMIETK